RVRRRRLGPWHCRTSQPCLLASPPAGITGTDGPSTTSPARERLSSWLAAGYVAAYDDTRRSASAGHPGHQSPPSSASLPPAIATEVTMLHGAEATKLIEAARALRPRILADRQRIESGRRLPVDLARELASVGFFRIYLPEAYGSLDLTPMAATEIFEELARADASVASCVSNGTT